MQIKYVSIGISTKGIIYIQAQGKKSTERSGSFFWGRKKDLFAAYI